MPYIYKITNKINDRMYIGKTVRTIEERWKEHLRDINRRSFEKRPLYDAMNKYGPENFHIEQIEEVQDVNELNNRECFWIETLGTFKNGYNATKGGDEKAYIDRELVIKTYQEVQNCIKTAKLLNISVDSVRNILKEKNIEIKSSQEIAKDNCSIPIKMLDKENKILRIFSSVTEASKFLVEQNLAKNIYSCKSHISQVCKGKRKTCGGYRWEYFN